MSSKLADTTKGVAKLLNDKFVLFYEIPGRLHSNQGSQCTSTLLFYKMMLCVIH